MKYRREIDGLRAVAVLPVILFHAGFEAFSGGFVGVDVFFVISGYLITTIILSDMNDGKFSIVTFYERRARRILPALFFVMFCCLPFAWFWLMPNHLKDFAQSLAAITGFSSNILFWRESGYFGTAGELKPLLHTWSLAVEEQYYVLFPLFLMALWKLRKRSIFGSLVVMAITSLILAQSWAYKKPTAAFFLLPTRGWELAIGALIAFYFLYKNEQAQLITSHKAISEALGALGLALIGYSIIAFDHSTPFPGVYALIPTIGTALIIIFATADTVVGRLLSTKFMVGIGLISYSTYLWHQPLFAFARHRNLEDPSVTLLLVLSVLSIALAYLSWRFVEMPFRDKKAIGRKKVFAFAILGSIAFAAIGLAGTLSKGFPTRIDLRITDIQSINMSSFEHQVKPSWDFFDKNPTISAAGSIGTTGKIPSFALIGDSHAGALLSEISSGAVLADLGGLNYTYRSCPPLQIINPKKLDDGDKICVGIRNSFFEGLINNNDNIPNIIVINARWALLSERERFNNGEGGVEDGADWVWDLKVSNVEYADTMSKVMVNSIKNVLSNGKKVILVYPVPEAGWQVPAKLAKILMFKGELTDTDASTSYSRYIERNTNAIRALDSIGEHENLIRIKPDEILCDTFVKDRCITHLNGEPLYFDDDHLSNIGARMIAAKIINHLKTEAL